MGFSKDAENCLACIFSVQGVRLSEGELSLFRESNPFGFILFGRNVESPDQVRALSDALKESVGRDCPVLIDQEGGRVQRLKPPHWGTYKPMQYFGDLWKNEPAQAEFELRNEMDRLIKELHDVGINVDCAPVLDVLGPATHEVIGDRAFAEDPAIVSALGAVVCEQFLEGGVTPVIKHIPGHGRASADSHLELPRVEAPRTALEKLDFEPFRALSRFRRAEAIWAMTAHIVYSALDEELPATLSPTVIEDIIRGSIGFEGILLGDDLDMKALAAFGDQAECCTASLEAGCDLGLYCWADLKVMENIAENCPKLAQNTLKRLRKADQIWEAAA